MSSECGSVHESSDYGLYSEEDLYDNSSVSDPFDDVDLYNEFNKLESDENVCESTTNILALSGPRIFALNPYEIAKIVEHDSRIESEFLANANSLHSLLNVCDKAIAIFHIVNNRSFGLLDVSANASTSSLEIISKSSRGD